ncbi:hypothetical protein DY000_02023305 [Brassica cretica]|uniref:Exostosin GT47 domain-containing protein n=1 Tax=Brassica cretica TaxID=69181 RepID=A0ABQ7E2U6_BRACR|nr:hypothetical protein DY000_02023305 [Brassica cretica]
MAFIEIDRLSMPMVLFPLFPREIKPKKLDTEPVRSQLRGLLLVLEGAMTNSTYVSRFSFILIPYRFKVRDSAFIKEENFVEERIFRRTNLQASATSRDADDLLFFRMPHFVLEMFAGLKMSRDIARDLS